MKLIFDTNIIYGDFHLHGPRITKLCSSAEKLGYDLFVPEVVVDEMVNQYRKKIIQHLPGYAGMIKMVARTQWTEEKIDKESFISSKVREYEIFLLKRFDDLGISIIPYPQVNVKSFVNKQLSVKKTISGIAGWHYRHLRCFDMGKRKIGLSASAGVG